jgi:hypothetical protein
VTFTADVRDELAHVPVGGDCCRRAELAAVLRLGGRFALRGGRGVGWSVDTSSGALARRVHVAARELGGATVVVEVHSPHGLRRATTYRLVLDGTTLALLGDLGLVDAQGRPGQDVPGELCRRDCDAVAYLRGALLGAGSVSDPRRAPHLEIGCATRAVATHLERVLRRAGAAGARAARHGESWRVVIKSSAELCALLARAGAHDAFLRFDAARLRRELRVAANRAANADRANVRRAVGAAAAHIAAIERLAVADGWDELDADLRALALARLANPEASLAELGRLLDPPVGKVTVHRRLGKLLALSSPRTGAGA